MKEVILFKDITTEDAMVAIEAESKKYDGLWVDMHEAEGRKYIKAQAETINDILKRLDRARIDKAKTYKADIEKEAAAIRERLEEANKPFTLLLDEYKRERQKVLDEEKARKQAIEDAIQLECDHEFALLMNDKFDSEKDKREAEKAAELERVREEARQMEREAIKAKQWAEDLRQQVAKEKAEKEAAEAASNEEHVASVHRNIKAVFVAAGFDDKSSETAVKLIVAGKLPHVKLAY